jgi:hypothetical protein
VLLLVYIISSHSFIHSLITQFSLSHFNISTDTRVLRAKSMAGALNELVQDQITTLIIMNCQ